MVSGSATSCSISLRKAAVASSSFCKLLNDEINVACAAKSVSFDWIAAAAGDSSSRRQRKPLWR